MLKKSARQRDLAWIAVLAVILIVTAIRIRLLNIPFERDEGEYAYMGKLMLHGIPPFSIAYNMKLPGTYAAYALMMALFGQSVVGVHLGLLVVNVVSILMMFVLGRRLFGSLAGAVAAIGYAVLTIHPGIFGTQAHATHFIAICALGGTLLLLRAAESRKLSTIFWSGLLFGLAFLMKQPGLLFLVFGVLYLIWSDRRVWGIGWSPCLRRAALMVSAGALPFAVTSLVLWRAGAFSRFWFWTFDYARAYGASVPLSQAWTVLSLQMPTVVQPVIILWILSLLGLVAALWDRELRQRRVFMVGFALFSVASVCPGFYFRPHYFVAAFPALALLIGTGISASTRLLAARKAHVLLRGLPIAVFALAVIWPICAQGAFFLHMTPAQASRSMYGDNPFPESVPIARYIAAHTRPTDTIAVLGSEPQIFFYSNRLSATGYIYVYSLMEKQPYAHGMQQEMISQLERARPKYIVVVMIPTSWLMRRDSDCTIMNWLNHYAPAHYDMDGFVLVDPWGDGESEYYWGRADATSAARGRQFGIQILKRRS